MRFDVYMALLACFVLAFDAWLWGGLPTLPAGLLMGLPLYCIICLWQGRKR